MIATHMRAQVRWSDYRHGNVKESWVRKEKLNCDAKVTPCHRYPFRHLCVSWKLLLERCNPFIC